MSSPSFELTNSVVRAGAGAGKTTGLVAKVIEVYRTFKVQGADGPRIVLTTFTRKATQELKERLIERAVKDKDPELLQFVSDSTRLHISTIHGLLSLVLRQVGHLGGMDAGFQIISEGEGDSLARLALRDVLVKHPEGMRWLEVYGFERVLGMCRKFRVFASEQDGVRPATIEDLERVAGERTKLWQETMRRLADEITGGAQGNPKASKWSAFAVQLLAATQEWNETFVSGENLPKRPPRSAKTPELDFLSDLSEQPMHNIRTEMSKPCWNQDLWPLMVKEGADFAAFAGAFAGQLRALKEDLARYEILDLELCTLELLRAKPVLAGIFSEDWDFWMIDEYQDTSPLQNQILQALIGDKFQYLVGDPQQSIYLFRGAEVSVFRDAEAAITKRGGQTFKHAKNYRSAPDLLHWINDFTGTLEGEFMRMEPREPVVANDRAVATLWRAPDTDAELQGLVTRVQELLQSGARLEDICVISRTHHGLMEVSRALRKFGFPTHVHAARGFAARREIQDAQALWKFLVNSFDNLSLMVLLRSPWFLVEDWQLAEWMADRPRSLWQKLNTYADPPLAILRLRETLAVMAREGVVRAFEMALTTNALLDLSLANDPAGRKESNLWKLIHRAQNLEREGGGSLLGLLQVDGENPLDSSEGDATSAQEPNCINLMTIHGSKGLEFAHVILPRLNEVAKTQATPHLFAEGGVFHFPIWHEGEGDFVPSLLDFHANQQRRTRELEESNRLLYVALTRAKTTLTLSWSGEGKGSWVERSPFFKKTVGVHNTSNYSYAVVEAMAEPLPYGGDDARQWKVRAPFESAAVAEATARISVTELVEQKGDGGSTALLQRWEARAAGTRIHRALESLKYGAANAHANGRTIASVDAGDEAVQYVLQLQDPPLCEWIHGGHPEWGFQVRTPGGVVEGQIDLWAKHDGKIYVVDYKSGSADFQEKAFQQLGVYAWALRKFGHQEDIAMVVVYPLLKKTEQRPFGADLFAALESKFGGT